MQLIHLLLTLAITTSSAIEIPFLSAITLPISLDDYFPPTFTQNETAKAEQRKHIDLLKRQNNACPTDFHACTNLNAPNLCCADAAICQPDDNGRVACCPSSSSCTGSVSGVITAGTVNTIGSLVGGASATASTSNGNGGGGGAVTSNGVVISSNSQTSTAQSASGSSFVVAGSGSARRAEMVSAMLRNSVGRC